MSDRPTWTQRTSRHYEMRHGGHRVELRYEEAGFQSRWAVYLDSRLIDRCVEFMQARGVAHRLAGGAA